MKLILAKFGWSILPIVLFLLFLGLIWFFFSWLLEKISDSNLYRVVKALSFTFLGVLVALALSSYRQDVPLSVGAKIEQIRQVEAQIEADKVKEEQKRLEKEALIKDIHKELEEALGIASDERNRHFDINSKPSDLITDAWLQQYLDLTQTLPDEALQTRYLERFEDVRKYFRL